jgi:hypothetical protein
MNNDDLAMLDDLIVALGGTAETTDSARSLLLKSEGDGLYQGPERDEGRIGAADWWQRLTKPASAFKGGYGQCSRCGAEVSRGGFVKIANVDGTSAVEEPPYTFACGEAPCVVTM